MALPCSCGSGAGHANQVLTLFFRTANQELEEFTAGVSLVGHRRTLFVVQSGAQTGIIHDIEQAANYYCLTTRNVNLDNYQAELKHFPVRFRSGITRGRGSFANYPNQNLVDLILVWDIPPAMTPEFTGSFRQLF